MGRFSTTVHIKNNVDRMRFVNTFSDVMKKRGFVPCSEDEAAQSYLFAFGEGWVTLANEEYKDNPQKAHDDVQQIAAALKTSAFSVEVVDSDFATLTLNNGDCVIVGDGSGYGIEEPERGTRECWEPVLAEGKTWEQFFETAEKNSVFVEETLGELAAMLGIDPYYICANFDEVKEKANNGNSVVEFYFKKADAKAKAISLNAAFKKIFGEALEPLGFKLIKGKYPYFVRVVPGEEIIHVITIVSEQGFGRNEKAFKISGGVATIYRGKVDLTINPRNSNWLIDIADVYLKTHRAEDNDWASEKLNRFTYAANDCCSMTEELVVALDYTKQYLLPVLDNVTTLSECADYYWLFHPMLLAIYYDKDWGMAKELGQSEGLMLFKIYDSQDYETKSMENIRQFKEEMLCAMKEGRIGYTPESLDLDCKRLEEQTKINVTNFDEHLNHPQHNADILNELHRRKKANSAILFQMGLNLQIR